MDPTTLERLAEQNFKEFVLCICDLIVNQEVSFDAIIGAGNSGLGVAEFVRIIYQELDLVAPPIIPIAISRKESMVSKSCQKELIDCLSDTAKEVNVLIPDDEIGHGRVVGAVAGTLNKIIPNESILTVVAENHGYDPKLTHPDFNITVKSFGEKHDGVYGVIFFVVGFALMNKIKSVIGPQEDDIKYANNLLLGLSTKELIDGQWGFVHRYDALVKVSIPDFEALQASYREKLHRLVREVLP